MVNAELGAGDCVFWLDTLLAHLELTIPVGVRCDADTCNQWFTAATPVNIKATRFEPDPTPKSAPSSEGSKASKAGTSLIASIAAAAAVCLVAIVAVLYRRRKGTKQREEGSPVQKNVTHPSVGINFDSISY